LSFSNRQESTPRRSLIMGALTLTLAFPCAAQEAADPQAREILETAIRMRAERLEGVENYTLVQSVNGTRSTLYFERVSPDEAAFRFVPPGEYEAEALEKAGLGGGFPGGGTGAAGSPAAGGPAGAAPGAGAAGGLLGGVLGGFPLDDLPLPEGLSLPGGGSGLPGALASGVSGLPGVPGAGRGAGDLGQQAGEALFDAATGGLQQQLMQKGMQGLMSAAASAGDGGAEDALLPVQVMQDLALTARLEGTETVDGIECFVLRSDGVRDPELARQMGGGMSIRSITMWIDAEEYVPLRGVVEGEATTGGPPQPMTIEILTRDYRRVEGMYEPFELVTRVGGMMDAIAAEDPEKIEQMRESMAKVELLEQQLAQMPPEQRRMVEPQMRQALAQLQGLSAGGDMEITTEVHELRVNAGPPTPFGTGYLMAEVDVSMELADMVVTVSLAADASGRVGAWVIQLVGAIEGYGGGVVRLVLPGDLPSSGEVTGAASAHFRWEDGRQAGFVAPEGAARVTIRSNDGARIAGEFSFDVTGEMQDGAGSRPAHTVVHGRFDAPIGMAPGS